MNYVVLHHFVRKGEVRDLHIRPLERWEELISIAQTGDTLHTVTLEEQDYTTEQLLTLVTAQLVSGVYVKV